MEKKKLSLPAQIFIALLLGIVVGLAFYFMGKPEITTNYLKPFGTIFVNLLKFIVVPVVLLSMIDGIVSMGDMKKVGSVGWKTVAYFLVTTAIACVIGLVFANIFNNAGLFPTLQLVDGQVWEKATTSWIPSSASSPVTSGSPSAPPICFRSSSSPFFSAAASSRQEKRASSRRIWSPPSTRSSSA